MLRMQCAGEEFIKKIEAYLSIYDQPDTIKTPFFLKHSITTQN